MNPTLAARHAASSASEREVMSTPPIRTVPVSALSIPAIRFNRVLLPEPDGPMSARNSPSAMSKEMSFSLVIPVLNDISIGDVEGDVVQHRNDQAAAPVRFGEVPDLDDGRFFIFHSNPVRFCHRDPDKMLKAN